MFVACLLLAIAIFSGTLLTFLFDRSAAFPARLAMGAVIGMALAAMIGYLLACVIGLTATCLLLTVAILLSPALLLLKPDFRAVAGAELRNATAAATGALSHPSRLQLALILFYVGAAVFAGTLFSFAVYQNSDGIYTGVTNNLGDLTLHLQVINSFVHGQNFPPQDPTFAGVRFAYPFLCDVLTAMLVRAGAGVIGAMWLQGTLLLLVVVAVMHYWTLLLTRSHLAGMVAVGLLLFSGGLGWSWMLLDLHNSEHGLIPLLANLQHDYTINLEGIFRWGNSLTALLIPQRSILFGIPMAIVIFCQWWLVINAPLQPEQQQNGRRRMLAAGIVAGLLPLSHAHTFLVVMGVGACLAMIFRHTLRQWLWFYVPAVLIALPQILWLAKSGTIQASSYIAWQPGWDHGNLNVVQFWLLNAGFFIPALLVALLARDADVATPRALLKYYLPFLFCFIVPNLIALAPWIWDNIKVLIYWYIASIPLVALLLARGLKQKTYWRWISAAALASMVLAGGLDVLRVMTGASPLREFSNADIAAAETMLANTEPRGVILQSPTWSSAVFLTGRLSVMGYPGWIGSRGLPYGERQADIQQIYAGSAQAEQLMKKYHVEYVVIGPAELASLPVNEQFWGQQQKLAEAGGYRLYRTKGAVERARR